MFRLSTKKFGKTSGGVLVPHNKNTENIHSEKMPIPNIVNFPMLQHIGTECTPCVNMGDKVHVGTIIGNSDAFLCVPIHSSVSGTVKSIGQISLPNGKTVSSIMIESDNGQTLDPSITPPTINSHKDFVAAVKASGLVGLGGAGFPTFVKLNPSNLSEIDTIVVNGAECEPFITSDYRECIENSAGIIEGLELLQKHLNVKNVLVGIENNKPEAIKILTEKAKHNDGIKIVSLVSRYPQGAEKVLIHELTGRQVGGGKLPSDLNCIVLNVSTVSKIAHFVKTGIPLVEKKITVDGDAVNKPSNLIVPIGTSVQNVLDFCGGVKENTEKILLGGPMMGSSVATTHFPIVKNNNAVLALTADFLGMNTPSACIKCGRCAEVCPMGLTPVSIVNASFIKDIDDLKSLNPSLCIACGCCSYACPAKLQVAEGVRFGKQVLADNK